jgi:hypothetical protein
MDILHTIVDEFSQRTLLIEELHEFLPLIDVEELTTREIRAVKELGLFA